VIRRSTWVVVGVFLALVAVYTLLGQREEVATPTPAVTPVPSLLDLDPTTVIGLSIERPADGTVVSVVKRESGWQVEPEGQADEGQVLSALFALSDASELKALDPTTALAPLGLDSPQAVVTIRLQGGEAWRLEVGAATPIGSGYYVRLDEDAPRVVDSYVIDALLAWLETPPLAPPTPTPTPAP